MACNVLKDIKQAATSLSRCTFKIAGLQDFSLAGVPLTGKTAFTLSDAARLVSSFASNTMPATFTLNVAVVNPNDGTAGKTRSTATLTKFGWRLLLDGTETISGDIPEPITIPGTGQQSVIPLRMNLDLAKFFKEKGYEHIVNLALALGGVNGSTSRVTLRARPTLQTDFGPLSYPKEIEIIDKEFRSQ
jgi:hypothetical protein